MKSNSQKANTPEGWITIKEAALITGASEAEIRRAARRIQRGRSYTIYGWPPGWEGAPRDLPTLPAEQLKQLHAGRIILNREMVLIWEREREHIQEARAQGARTAREIAAELGMTAAEVLRSARRIEEEERIKELLDQGRTIEEIAQALGMKLGTVRYRLRCAEARERWREQQKRDAHP